MLLRSLLAAERSHLLEALTGHGPGARLSFEPLMSRRHPDRVIVVPVAVVDPVLLPSLESCLIVMSTGMTTFASVGLFSWNRRS